MAIRPFPVFLSKLAGSRARRDAVGAVCVLVAAMALAPLTLQQDIDNRIEQWLKPNSEEAARYEQFRERFGSDEIIVVEYKGRPLFDAESLRVQVDVLTLLEEIPEVVSVAGIPAVYRDIYGLEDPDELREEFTNTDFYRDFLISDDGTVAGLIMETDPPNDIAGRRRMVHQIDTAVAQFRSSGWTTHVVGPPVLNVSLDDTSKSEALRLIPISLAISTVVLLFFLRSFRAVLVGLASAAVTLLITVGMMAAADRPMNMVTTSMPALVWVLSLAGLIHLLHTYLSEDGDDTDGRLAGAIAKTRRPCAISSVTTAGGFFSLGAAPMRAVQDFGIFAGAGLLVAFVVTFTLATTLVRLLRPPGYKRSRTTALGAMIDRAAHVAVARPVPVLLLSLALVLIASVLLPRLRTESNPLNFLPASSDVSVAYRTVPEELTGLYTLELLIQTPRSWLKPETLRSLDRLATAIEAMPEVAHVVSPVAYLRKLNQWDHEFDASYYVLPESELRARSLLEEADDTSHLYRFALKDESAVRLAVLVRVMNSTEFTRLVKRVEVLPEFDQLGAEMTGVVLQLVHAQDTLVIAQIRSLGLAFLLIVPCILIGLRSVPLTLLSLVPNSMPILAAFALMAIMNIRLDAATVMVACIAIGIAVDDTVHVLCAYQREARRSADVASALRCALAQVGPSITITTLTSLSGFLVLLRSQFVPLQHFGLIAGCALVVALCADVFVLPAAVTLLARRNATVPSRRTSTTGNRADRGDTAETI